MDRLYMPTLLGGGGLGARSADVPEIGEFEGKELCAGPTATLGHDDGPGGCGVFFQGGLRFGPPASVAALTTT
jgi:hypothetical protein